MTPIIKNILLFILPYLVLVLQSYFKSLEKTNKKGQMSS